jgi:hypothetical protein
MADTTIQVLKQAIARLEEDLSRHRQALHLLEEMRGPGVGAPARVARRPVASSPAPARTKPRSTGAKPRATGGKKKSRTRAAKQARPAAGARPKAAQSTALTQLIRGVLSTASTELTPAEIVKELGRQGHRVDPNNVHRRLSDLAKSKGVTRNAGKYTIAK